MKDSLRLGRIAGIRVGLHISVLVIVFILVAGLATGQFPALVPGASTAAYVVAATIAAVLFLGSLLAHEVAHAVVARRNGVEVEGITLWLLGGVAQLRGEPRTPGAEFRVAAVGPATSIALAVAFGLAAEIASAFVPGTLIFAVLGYLAGINAILAAFNLVPAAPLDGGRLLRAALWRWRGDPAAAAVAAARAGRVFGFLLVALGALQVVSGLGLSGLWLALLGLFLVSAATAEEQQTRLGSQLAHLRVRDVMTPWPTTARGDEAVETFIHDVVLRHRFSSYPLVDPAGHLVGLVTLNRIRAVPPEARALTLLRDIACQPADLPTTQPDEPLADLLSRLSGCADGRAVVVDDDDRVVVGIVTPSDVSRAMQLHGVRVSDPNPTPADADLTSAPRL